jgi:putative hemolysin
LLWQGTWSYVVRNKVDVMIGCASFEGTDLQQLALPLSFLHHHARAPEGWRVGAVAGKGQSMNRMAQQDINTKEALRSLPPLIKGYLRVGAWIGEEAVFDPQFGTTDVLILLPVANINPRYITYFGT